MAIYGSRLRREIGRKFSSKLYKPSWMAIIGPAALGIPKGDACYRRDARNEGNCRNFGAITDGWGYMESPEGEKLKEKFDSKLYKI
jgi:hypothetical protein